MRQFIYFLCFTLITISCKKNKSSEANIEPKKFNGKIEILNLKSNEIEIETEIDFVPISTDGNFSINPHSVLLAKKKNTNQPVYFGLVGTDEISNYFLDSKETALYFALSALPNIRRQYYKPYLKKLKTALYQYQEVKDLELKIKNSILQNGYLDYNFVGTTLGIAIDKILTEINAVKKSYTVNQRTAYDASYAAGGGYYRVDASIPTGWTDTYEASTQIYKLKRKMYNSTAAIVGVQIGKWNSNTYSASLPNSYIGFIEPFYPPNLTSIDGTISNFKQFWEATEDIINNGTKDGNATTDAYSKDNEFIFNAKQGEKDAIVFVNGYYDNKIVGLNIAYLFIDNFQDVFEDNNFGTGNDLFSKNDFINGFLGDMASDAANAVDLANYATWFIDGNLDLIEASLLEKLEKYAIKTATLYPQELLSILKEQFSKGFKIIAGSYSSIYKYSRLAYKIASQLPLSSSKKFAAAIPINFSLIDFPPAPYNPTPFNTTIANGNQLNFSWQVSNPTNQALRYNLYLGTSTLQLNSPTLQIASNLLSPNFSITSLNVDDNRYYWQVEVINQNGQKTLGAIWTFDYGNFPFKPKVGTLNVTAITSNSAGSGGVIFSDGGSTILQKGICYSAAPNPNILGLKTIDGSGDALYTSLISNLNTGSTYYVRAYATNSKGTSYGEQYIFQTLGGSSLPSITIGTQIWTTKNLDVVTYRNGDPIPQVTNPSQFPNLTTGAWCYYNNDPANNNTYGKLYNWYAVNDSRGLAPTGWHIPSYTEYNTLIAFLGGASIAGGKMKTTNLWNNPNTGATNSSGFNAVPSGVLTTWGTFDDLGNYCKLWTSSEGAIFPPGPNPDAIRFSLSNSSNEITNFINNKSWGFSVRCIKD